MSEDKMSIFAGSKTGKPPSPRKLKQFIDGGGYAILESMGTGKTSEEKQMTGWEKHGIISKLEEKTNVTRPTIHRIKAWFPTLKSTGMLAGVWVKAEDFKLMEDIYTRLKNAEKFLKVVQDYFDRSLVIDLSEFRIRRELLGESIESLQLALKQQLEAGKKERSYMEKVLDDALEELRHAWLDLHFIIKSQKTAHA